MTELSRASFIIILPSLLPLQPSIYDNALEQVKLTPFNRLLSLFPLLTKHGALPSQVMTIV
jgi:hypothetical protein